MAAHHTEVKSEIPTLAFAIGLLPSKPHLRSLFHLLTQ